MEAVLRVVQEDLVSIDISYLVLYDGKAQASPATRQPYLASHFMLCFCILTAKPSSHLQAMRGRELQKWKAQEPDSGTHRSVPKKTV